jgi:2,3-bisphosphoglycerate-independent phosphoglycerate mutase
LDGFGIGKESRFNAIANAKMPFFRDLWARYPHSQLLTHGPYVGLPEGVMGNSEVGHMTLGAGRIIYQDLTRISKAIADGEFKRNPVIRKTLEAGAHETGRVHLLGLLSDGGVHSHLDHLLALLDLCQELRIPEVLIHCFLDGRDTPPDSSAGYVQQLLRHPIFQPGSPCSARIASVMGRYYAMDRDKRWDRVQKAFEVLTGAVAAAPQLSPLHAIEASHRAGKTDEFVEPVLLDPSGAIRDGDSAFFFNFRSDRARELSGALWLSEFAEFAIRAKPRLSAFAGMTNYDKSLGLPFAFGPQNLEHLFGEWLESRQLRQFRIAETEKYAHVTFFFNGGREAPFVGEDRVLIPSPKDVATYDLKPEMSAPAVAEEAAARLRTGRYDFLLMNFANADMVGHTGNYAAAVRAMEALDSCLQVVIGTAQKEGYHVLLTADHGNAEEMVDCRGRIHTQHTLNPVPALWVAPGTAIAPKKTRKPLRDGGLQDVMPTLCELMGLDVPPECTGKSLLPPS